MNMKEYLSDVGLLVYKIRIEKGITQQELAELADVSDKTICNIENGKKDIVLSTIVKVLVALKIEANDILKAQWEVK